VLALALALVYGSVTMGPVTPVCQAGTPCDKPAAQVTLTFTRAGHTTSTKTGVGGAYRVRLAPGIYIVRASAGMSMRPHAVNVHAPRTHLDFSIDTGIR
jgi:hypothetical protein